MQADLNELVKDALELNATHAAIADASKIIFHEDYRKACEKNVCRKYDTNWMGPPAIGPITELMEKVRKYKQGLLIQTVCHVSGSFDMKGMFEGMKVHEQTFRSILENMKIKYNFKDILPLNAGCCSLIKLYHPWKPMVLMLWLLKKAPESHITMVRIHFHTSDSYCLTYKMNGAAL